MPRNRHVTKVRYGIPIERFRTVLQFGPERDYFGALRGYTPSLAELKAAWTQVGPEIMQDWEHNVWQRAGSRPWGWWIFESGLDDKPDYDSQPDWLREHRLLSIEEEQELAERARKLRSQAHDEK